MSRRRVSVLNLDHDPHCGCTFCLLEYDGHPLSESRRPAHGPPITQLAFDAPDFERAERMARHLGYKQTVYTSTSALWGLFCLPERPTQRKGCIIKTKEFGLLFVQDEEDLLMDSA